jgi:hypothetical protein
LPTAATATIAAHHQNQPPDEDDGSIVDKEVTLPKQRCTTPNNQAGDNDQEVLADVDIHQGNA